MNVRHLTLATLCLAGRLSAQQPDIGPPPGTLVAVGGRKLHLLCSGAGSPTVVLEAGASSFAIDWTLVQRDVARTNRVCSYDRAGMGWSDPSPSAPAPSPNATRDLHTLLGTAGERPPYVLVGASLGGLLVRVYHADYPYEVVGLVLVDPSSEDRLFTYFQGQPVAIASLTAEQLRTTLPQQPVPVPRRNPQTGVPFDRLPPPLYDLRVKLDTKLIASMPATVSPEFVAATREEERARLARLAQLRAAQQYPLGSRPTVVLTRGAESNAELQATHAGLARLSENSRHTVVAGAGHEVHLVEPGAVVQAIADVVEAVRSKTRLPQR